MSGNIRHSCSQTMKGVIPVPELECITSCPTDRSSFCPQRSSSNLNPIKSSPGNSPFFLPQPNYESPVSYDQSSQPQNIKTPFSQSDIFRIQHSLTQQPKPLLPVLNGCNFPYRISPHTLAHLLRNELIPLSDNTFCEVTYDNIVIVDCRFTHEFDAGHIVGAVNLLRMSHMIKLFKIYENRKTCFIFHCELSATRSIKWISLFRDLDRSRPGAVYPHLMFPEIYLLDGGFKKFYETFKDRPAHLIFGDYLPMEQDSSEGKTALKASQRVYEQETGKKISQIIPLLLKNVTTFLSNNENVEINDMMIMIDDDVVIDNKNKNRNYISDEFKTCRSLSADFVPTSYYQLSGNCIPESASQPLPRFLTP